MNFSLNGGSGLVLLIPVIVWVTWIYLIIRFLNAFERGVYAHARIADVLSSSRPGGRGTSQLDDRPPDAG
jgi:hypothetical protein